MMTVSMRASADATAAIFVVEWWAAPVSVVPHDLYGEDVAPRAAPSAASRPEMDRLRRRHSPRTTRSNQRTSRYLRPSKGKRPASASSPHHPP
jgi:hypothetical protein